ncbi:MAG: PaaI family thioesterase [Minwuia sp.]|uniref:PaaI family thioesterase n=1 Tax=Minwuia sp. TaxID=2493630 RepID=UPI003A84C58E
MNITEAVAQARTDGDYQGVIDSIPYMKFLGLTVSSDENGPLVMMPGSDHIIGNPVLPAIHGGVVGAFLESAAIVHLIWAHESRSVPKIINLTVEYLRSARVVDTYAQATITKHGRRIANMRIEAWQADRAKPVAAAHAHFLLPGEES